MRILKLQYRNIQSTGNILQEIEFGDDPHMWMVIGRNGSGKSSIATALTYGLYGKVEKKTISDIVNRTNKSAYVKITLVAGGREIVIERGHAPSVFKVWIDDEPYDEAGKTNMQDYLETEIYRMPLNVFTNTLVLSIKHFSSFLSMNTLDKKKIIDRLFGFDVINMMRETLRSEIRDISRSLDTSKAQQLVIDQNISDILGRIEVSERINNEEKEEELDKLKEAIRVLLTKRTEEQDTLDRVHEGITKLQGKQEELLDQARPIATEIHTLQEKVSLLDSGSCPTCERPFEEDAEIESDEYKKKIESLQQDMLFKQTEIDDFKGTQASLVQSQQELTKKINTLNSQLLSCKDRIKNLTTGHDVELNQLNKLLEDNTNALTATAEKIGELQREHSFLDMVETYILGETGIKNIAIKSILPILNSTIQELIPRIGNLDFSFEFDDKFDCKIRQFGHEVKPITLSEGERSKADTIVLLSIIRLLKIKYPELNLLFLDEIFASVDPEGIYTIINTINGFKKEFKMHTLVINHVPLPPEMFDMRIAVQKQNNFSEINIEQVD